MKFGKSKELKHFIINERILFVRLPIKIVYKEVMEKFINWINNNSIGRPVFISDNLAFDWSWINYYMHYFLGKNPFGFSGRRIGDLYCGIKKDAGLNQEWKKLYRKTRHTHHPVQDCIGNAEALLSFRDKLGLKIKF